MIESESEDLRRGCGWCVSQLSPLAQDLGAQKQALMIEPSVQAENELPVFCSCQAPGTLKDACHTGEGHFLSLLVFSVNLFQS